VLVRWESARKRGLCRRLQAAICARLYLGEGGGRSPDSAARDRRFYRGSTAVLWCRFGIGAADEEAGEIEHENPGQQAQGQAGGEAPAPARPRRSVSLVAGRSAKKPLPPGLSRGSTKPLKQFVDGPVEPGQGEEERLDLSG
jgi:hypothetical protein